MRRARSATLRLQELLSDEVSTHLVSVLCLAMIARAGRHRTDSQEAIGALRGIIPDDGSRTGFAAELDRFAIDLRKRYPASPALAARATAPTTETVDFICRDRLIAAHPAYAQGGWLDQIVGDATLHLRVDSRPAKNWTDALDTYEGVRGLPLMTIHESKGLEFHTVIFVGLDDDAWRRNFEEDRAEATAGFFVAFTRAKQRVILIDCAQRGSRQAIARLYQLSLNAGVKIIDAK
jgi:superfamily I DNA/RNA helicase